MAGQVDAGEVSDGIDIVQNEQRGNEQNEQQHVPLPPFWDVARSPGSEPFELVSAELAGEGVRGNAASGMATSLGGSSASASSLSHSASVMLDDCRKELSHLRQLVKTAASQKAASLSLLSDASDLVVKLEDIVYNRALQPSEREQLIHRVGHRALLAMDRAEGVVQKYGHASAVKKMFQSRETTKGQFEDAAEEIEKVALVADGGSLMGMKMMMVNQGQQTLSRDTNATNLTNMTSMTSGIGNDLLNRGLSGQSAPSDAHLGRDMSAAGNEGNVSTFSNSNDRPETINGGMLQSPPSQKVSENKIVTANAANAANYPYATQQMPSRTVSRMDTMFNSPTVLSKTDGVTTVTEYDGKELFKGSKQAFLEAGTSMELETISEEDGDTSPLGSFLWIYSSKILGQDRMTLFNTFDGSRQTIQSDRGTVTAMHYDPRGVLWTGHRGGQVTAWNVHTRKPYCKSIKVSSGQIKAVTSDEAGTAWVGSEKGDVRRVTLAEQLMDSEVIGYELLVTGQLKHSGSGTPDISASHPVDANGMVINLRAKEKAHNGPVTAILAAAGRVWTSGGSPAFVSFKEWTQRGEFMNKREMKVTGAATCMKLVSPFVAVRTGVAADQFNSTGTRKTSQADIRQQYQVLMGYANGTIGVWGPINGLLCQFIRIGRHVPPITGLAVLDEMGMVATSHIDGKIRLRVPPRVVDKDRLSVAYTDQSVYSINLNLIELVASKAGDSIMGVYAHKNGMSYATAATKTVFVSNDTLSDIVVQSGAKILRGMGNKLSSCSPEWASKNVEESYSDEIRGAEESFSQMKSSMLFPQDAFQWMIDYADLTQTRVIGEGAFGKVYLGKWHETDVAIKALTSLGALGISAGQIASYATEADVKDALRTLEREVGLMVGMRHPNVILFLGVCPDPPCVVTEYCARGSLYDVLVEAKEHPTGGLARALTWYRRVSMMLDAAKGMLYLHSHKPTIIHRDLKSPNLLVDGNWNVKVTDFNLSRLADVTQPGVTSSVVANNPRWHAPEIIRDALFTKPGDVYAFGLIMWEMITWELPYDSMNSFQMILFVGDKGGRPPVPDLATERASEGGQKEWHLQGGTFPAYESYVDLMVRCWDQNPERRPAFPEIISKLRDILSTFSESDARPLPSTASERDDSLDANGVDEQITEATTEVPEVPTAPFDVCAAAPPSSQQSPFVAMPNPFDMSSGPFGATNTPASPFDAAPSGDIPEVNLETRGSMEARNSGGRDGRARNVVDSVMETNGGGSLGQ